MSTKLSPWEKWVQVISDPRVLFLILLSLSAGSLVRELVHRATGGVIRLNTQQDTVIECVQRVVASEDFQSDADRLAGIKVCLPSK